ncbi:hypothetical protein B0T21DRAFT_385289 [Apiosordaria backusii]|uniref:Uncharacterized protein n=1 Tax=Apiosordaria backusii TaxID=314023 RepID=A0AA40E8M7_9PEZI|nr:hypothetical protein B0T21DRAFT_385289 [Apiosordaria backusii]
MLSKTPTFLNLLLLVLSLSSVALSAPATTPRAPKPRWYETYSQVARRAIVPQSYYEVLHLRRSQYPLANPRTIVKDVVCLDRRAHIVAHDEAAASLQICNGSISGAGGKCQGSVKETSARMGTAVFTLRSLNPKQTINVSKERWQQCAWAAREACPTGSLSGVCLGGATRGGMWGLRWGQGRWTIGGREECQSNIKG